MFRTLTVTLFCLAAALSAYAQNTLDKAGLGAGVTASAAYSIRRLSSSYTGKLLQVRRSTDNTTQDIGYTANDDLDTAALKTFVGAGSGYVSIWYDQSGQGNNLKQTTTGYQPALVNAGVINRENTRPFIRFWGALGGSFYFLGLTTAMSTVGHVSAVIKFASGGDGFILSAGGSYNWHSNAPNTLIFTTYANASVINGSGWSNGTSYAPKNIPWPTTLSIEELEPQTPTSGTNWDNIGDDRSCCHYITGGGGYSELILFSASLSTANRQALETNQKPYFGIVTLPVTWLSFTAQSQKATVLLQWQTATEQNSKDFIVQYSTNGDTWTNLASLPAAGNSTATTSYKYVHSTPRTGDNYYRIAETDLDGKTTYTEVDAVNITAPQPEFQVLQNPVVGGQLQVRVNTPTTLSLYSMDGKLLQRAPYGVSTIGLPLSGYPKGTYLLTGKTTTVQVLVQ